MASPAKNIIPLEVCILAGGHSSRMGQDKAKLRLSSKTLLTHVKTAATALACRVRVIRRDLVPRCGPLGGVHTALKTTGAREILFLSCDMPFMPGELLRRLRSRIRPKSLAVFTRHGGLAGFPFLLKAEALPQVEELMRVRRLALQELAAQLKAMTVRPTRREARLLLNVNTPEDWRQAKRLWSELTTPPVA